MSDSATSGHLLSPDRRKIACLVPSNNRRALCFVDLVNGNSKVLNEAIRATPEQWSPDSKQLVVSQRDGGFIKYSVVNSETGVISPLPILNAKVCGWSADGQSIYQMKNKMEEYTDPGGPETVITRYGPMSYYSPKSTTYEPQSELFETNLVSNQTRTIWKKSKDVRASFSTSNNKFLLRMDNNVYLLG
jgi:hypothetical protein